MTATIWWIRRDLRLTDNTALQAAVAHANRVIPLFVLTPSLLGSSNIGLARTAFLFGGLRQLDSDLQQRGSRLIVRQGDPAEVLTELVSTTQAQAVYAERDYSPYATARDQAVADVVNLHLVDGVSIRPIGTVLKKDGTSYTVFTPYRNSWLSNAPVQCADLLRSPKTLPGPGDIESLDIPETPAVSAASIFPPGEREAKRRLASFLKGDGHQFLTILVLGGGNMCPVRRGIFARKLGENRAANWYVISAQLY